MKVTGAVRRIDDLGRIVIPKEIRRNIGLREGEAMEIFLEDGDTICLRKYKNNLSDTVDHLKEQIKKCGDDLTYDTLMRIGTLLEEVKDLIKGEE